jgi:5-dehydro-2-deoxygluconokinase
MRPMSGDIPEALVVGRLHVDLYPLQIETPLQDVRTFERFAGGFAANVGIGLARLGVQTSVISAVGDDGLGRFLRARLEREGIDTRGVGTHPTLRTALSFCEIWPPDRFPLTAYRFPTCPDWELIADDVPEGALAEARVLYVSGTGLAQEPSRSATHAALEARRPVIGAPGFATILDLDWRDGYWRRPDEYPAQIRQAAALADTIIGSDTEFAVARLTPEEAVALGARRVFVKHGPLGASLLADGMRRDSPAVSVQVVNGLGAGDAFAAAVGWGLLRGQPAERILAAANTAGAIVATRFSCSDAMPTAGEVEAMLATGVVPREAQS